SSKRLSGSVQGWTIDVVDNEGLNGTAAAVELETEALDDAVDGSLHVLVFGIDGVDVEVPGAGDAGLVEDGQAQILAQARGEVIGGGVGANGFAIHSGGPSIDDGARIGVRIIGRYKLKRLGAAREEITLALFGFEMASQAEALEKERL